MASGARVFSNGKMVNQQQGHQDQSMSTMAGSSAGAMTVADGVPLVGQSGQHSQQEEKEGVEAEASQGSSIACAIATMLFSIPALVGS